MSFGKEWAEMKSAASDRQTAMRLNQVEPGGGGPGPQGDLKVDDQDLAAVGDAAFKLHQRLGKDGDHATASTREAAGTLKQDFTLGAALTAVADKWHDQVGTLRDACGHISNHLDYTQKAHAGDEHFLATQIKYAQLDKGFEERAQN
ncbi:hypothetical protein [Streptomyces sp. G-G2]|uniref:hypothetical protein n=1 Tax=Streptomyces sp. G-G2 TaxID=3046201 RepID=UPI0024B91CC7|nr:hypothetical protein [Streptomyces sp. G-G2]MDJ0380146.1 hypothetical protein [Streptomyces sp. G-G2]